MSSEVCQFQVVPFTLPIGWNVDVEVGTRAVTSDYETEATFEDNRAVRKVSVSDTVGLHSHSGQLACILSCNRQE